MLFAALFAASLAHAATAPQDCLKVSDSLDRKYCMDKYLQSVKVQYDSEKKTWDKGLSADAKQARTDTLSGEVSAKKEYIALLQSEIALAEQQLASLNGVATTAPATAAPKKKEKKKNKLPFGIKL